MKDRERYKHVWQGALELALRRDPHRMLFLWGMQARIRTHFPYKKCLWVGTTGCVHRSSLAVRSAVLNFFSDVAYGTTLLQL